MNKKVLIIMCGAPGAGKTTYAKTHMNEHDAYVSRDETRMSMLNNGEHYFSKENQVFETYIQKIQECLNTDGIERVICDATHNTEDARDKLCDALDMTNVESILCWVVRPSLEEELRRNENRLNEPAESHTYVPRSVIKRMYWQFERPEEDTNYHKDVMYVEVPE